MYQHEAHVSQSLSCLVNLYVAVISISSKSLEGVTMSLTIAGHFKVDCSYRMYY